MRALLVATFCLLIGCGGGDGDGAALDAGADAAAEPCAACGPGTVCVQRLTDFPSRCPQGQPIEVRCVATTLQCPPGTCTPECQTALCPLWSHRLGDGGVLTTRETCAAQGCAEELPQAFLCYHGE